MPRVYDLDDDDYFPREQGRKSARGFPVLLSVGIGVGLIVMVAVALFAMRSSRQAAEQDAAAFARTAAPPRMMPADVMARRSNWTKVLGGWRREPDGISDTKYPYRFDFRPDRTAAMTRQMADGSVQVLEASVEVFVDEANQLQLRLRVPNGVYVYRFQFEDDNTLILTDGPTEIEFTRAK